MSEDVRPFEEYKEMIKDMRKEEMIKGLYDLSARITEQDKEIERLNKMLEETIKEYEHKQYITDLITENGIICQKNKEIERLHSIIKEVREYIKDACYLDEINYPNSLGHKQTMKVLEILDKENEE